MKTNKTFLPLYITNFFGTLNDNFLKMLASFTVTDWLPDERVKSIAMGVTAGALVLPYMVAVRPAPPRDDAHRGLDRPREGMVEANAA